MQNLTKIRHKLKIIHLASFIFICFAVAFPVYAADPISEPSCKDTSAPAALKKCVSNNQLVKDIQSILNALTIGVGVIIVIMIIVGGIQYMVAGDNPEGITKAKKRITNALIALLAFIFLDAFVQWLVPGGIFG